MTHVSTANRQDPAAELLPGEANLRTMTEALPQLVWATTAQGVDDYRNGTWFEFTGLPRGPVRPDMGIRLVHEDDLPRVRAAWAHCVATGEPYQTEYRLRHHSGEYRWVLARALPLRDPSGTVVRWLGTATDIHDHKVLEADLRDTRRRLQGALAAAEIGTWSWDLKNDRIWGDRNCAQLFGLSVSDAAGGSAQIYFDRIHPDDLASTRTAVARSLRSGEPYQDSFRVRRDGGGWRHIHARAKVELDEQGRPAWLPGVALDVTREKQAEEALRLMDRRKDEFLATLAHELRNPLAPIATAAALIPRVKTHADKVEQLAAVIARQAQHMTGLVEDLLDVSRVTRGQVTLKMERVGLRDVLVEALEQVQPQAVAKRQTLSSAMADERIAVYGDKKRLVQVLVNLLTNAVRYTPADGAILVHVRAEGPWVVLRVEDNGIGMSDELCRSAFDLFTQGERTADRSQGGLGIGLALVKTLVELHGGQVHASSRGPGLGSSFEVMLARLEPPAAEYAAATAEPMPISPGQLRVLVVDDNQDAAELLAMLLTETGFQVTTTYSADAALQAAGAIRPQVCLLDIGLPGMTGHELARRLHRLPGLAHTAIAAVTGYDQPSDRVRTREAGFEQHFAKPVDLRMLINWLYEVMLRSGAQASGMREMTE